MIKYNRQIKSRIFKEINKNPQAFEGKETEDYYGIIKFLNNIWDLKGLPSPQDTRWSNAYDDAIQHLVNNDDWSYEYTFLDRFELLENDEDFTKFLETVVHPDFRNNLQEIQFYVELINSELLSFNYALTISDYKEDLPIYTIKTSVKRDEVHVLQNTIPFLVNHHSDQYPYFYLESNNWDDYGSKTTFKLFYYTGIYNYVSFGELKITNGINDKTLGVIDEKFTSLNDTFCSLGQSEDYYIKLQKNFKQKMESILFALKDSAYFVSINDKFSSNSIYKYSLIRYDEIEQLSRNVKFLLEGINIDNKYKFTYSFIPNYSETPVKIDFTFNSALDFSDRIFAVIGKNGAGKTQLITSLPVDISESKEEVFSPHIPIFSKIIAVSYSVFDNFKKPDKNINSTFNYIFCGLLNEDKTFPSKADKIQKFIVASKSIKHHVRVEKWYNVLSNFLDNDILNDLFIINQKVLGYGNDAGIEIDETQFPQIIDKLSSGQSIILEIMTKIIANIRYDSLILFDEPETHLHPNAISQLISSIYELVESFDSYCIIATHSPIIIQNIFGKNVYVMEKDNDIPFLRKVGVESFGENLTVLTEDVFSNREIDKHYKVILDKMIIRYSDYDTILHNIQRENLPLSLNAKIYLKSKLS